MLPGVFYKNPSIPDEVLKYREPMIGRTSRRTDSGETQQYHISLS